jgi:hypothetical protein
MKKILTILLVASLLPACNSKNDNTGNADSATVVENHADHEKAAEGLALNNGAKWKADSTTLLNVTLLQTIVSGAQKESPDNYVQTAKQLENGLSKMISECKMKGADHDALHKWLEPRMEKTKDLKKVSSVENAATVLNEIEKQVNLFPQYFEK